MKFLIGCLLLELLNLAHAGTVVLRKQKIEYPITSEGSLREFFLQIETKKTTLRSSPTPSFSTDARFVYRTNRVDEIKDYGIVQWIRGCQYSSTFDGKDVHKNINIARHYFSSMIDFKHAKWEIDSDNNDPVYANWKDNRHGLLRWNNNPASLDPGTATYVFNAEPPHPKVFATDLPGSFTTSINGSGELEAKNSSLEFETCLFKMSDLPLESTPDGAGINKEDAVACLKWESKFIYDFKTKTFNMNGPIDPFCLGKE